MNNKGYTLVELLIAVVILVVVVIAVYAGIFILGVKLFHMFF